MCAACSQHMTALPDSGLCQKCQDKRDLKELEGMIEHESREVDCLLALMANLDITRVQNERNQDYSQLAEENRSQVAEMKRSERLARRKLNNLIEQKLNIEERIDGRKAVKQTTFEPSVSGSKPPTTTSGFPPFKPKVEPKIELKKKVRT